MISTGFTFNGITSETMGVSLVRLESGVINTPFTSSKTILETHPNRVLYPYFHGVKHNPLEFTITIASETNDMDSSKLYSLAQWLFKTEYKPFISDDNPNRVYYVMAINKADFITNGLDEGYFTIQFRCRDGFAWTVEEEEVFDLSASTGSTPISMGNDSNIDEWFYPELEIQLQGTDTEFELINTDDSNNNLKFTGLEVGETIYIDNQKRIILSSQGVDVNKFGAFNGNWFRLQYGVNTVNVVGKCIITYKKLFPVFT